MLIRRSAPQRNFTVLPNEFLQDERMTWATRGLLAEVLSRPDGWIASADSLAKRATGIRGERVGEGRRAVRAMFAEAEEFGYIIRSKEHIPAGEPNAGHFQTVLTFYDVPQPVHQGTATGTSIRPAETAQKPRSHRRTGDGTSMTGTSIERTENKEPNGITSCVGVAPATPNGSRSDRHGIDADAPTVGAGASIPKQKQPKANKPQQQRQLSDRVSPQDRAKCNHYISLLSQLDDDGIDDALTNLWISRERLWVSAYQEMRKKYGGEPLPKRYDSRDHGYIDPDTPQQARFMYEKALRFMSRDGNWDDSLIYPLELLEQADKTSMPSWAA